MLVGWVLLVIVGVFKYCAIDWRASNTLPHEMDELIEHTIWGKICSISTNEPTNGRKQNLSKCVQRIWNGSNSNCPTSLSVIKSKFGDKIPFHIEM